MSIRLALVLVLTSLLAVFPVRAGNAAWQTVAHLESPRAGLGAAALDGELYVAGGRALAGPQSAFESFDPKANLWTPLTSLPNGVSDFGMAALGGQIFIAGGFSASAKGKPTSELWIYDKAAARWLRGADMPGARAGHGLVVAQGKLYAIGGAGQDATRVYIYDPARALWSVAGAAFPHPRQGLAVAFVAGRIYAVGGRDAAGTIVATVDIYDPTSEKWSAGPPLPEARSALTAGALGGVLHVTGGQRLAPFKTYAEHLVLASNASTWSRAADMPTPRHGIASAVVDGAWYVMGGGTGAGVFTDFTASDVVEVFRP